MGVTDRRLFSLLVDPRDAARANQCEQFRSAMARGLSAVRGMDELIRAVGQRYNAAPGDIALGADFTDVGLRGRSDFSNYRIVFFGTHGLLPNTGDCLPEPALVTSLGPGDSDGFLDASEILDLRLDAELIVLAACNTGGVGTANPDRTGLTGSGEALGGLARDFIYAGGRSLVVSQWSVDQAATVQLMNRIFAQGAAGQADALQRAQQALMDVRQFSHPYFWAGFSLLGDGARQMV
jgi:CHAT domain-containing protein